MLQKIKNFLWLLICESDERYPDLSRIGLIIGIISMICISVYAVVFNKSEFSASEFGIGISAVLFGGGTAVGIRAHFEDMIPGKKQDLTKDVVPPKQDVPTKEDLPPRAGDTP